MKRFFVAALVLAALLLGAASSPAVAALAVDWPQDGYGAGNTGYNPDESIINAGSVARLRLRWSVTPDGGTPGCYGPAAPVIAQGRMFIVDGDGVGAYDAVTGRLLWRNLTALNSDVGRTLTVVGNLIITTGWSCYGMSQPGGDVLALDTATGRRRWFSGSDEVFTAVGAERGMFFTSYECAVCGSVGVTVRRAADGKQLWQSGDGLSTGPVAAGGRLLLTDRVNGSAGAALSTGRRIWTSPIRWMSRAADPAGATFYATDPTNRLAALDAATGTMRWSVPNAGGMVTADGRRVFVAAATLSAYDARTGRRLWQRPYGPVDRPVRAGGLLYVGDAAISPVTGAIVRRRAFGGRHVVISNGLLYVTNPTGIVTAYTPARSRGPETASPRGLSRPRH